MADAVTFPVSFRDPQYASLDASHEQKLGLPDGLLASIRTNGERSNADQVSSAGAKTPYQITPATRDLAIKKWGIDPYLSAQNASEVAGLLLKDSLDRNQGDASRAVAEYHGGTDPANWGPKTRAYVQRVTQGLPTQDASQSPDRPQVQGFTGPSTFDKALAQIQSEQAPSQLNAIYQAYQSGQMTPEESQQFEQDVKSGRVMLPQGAQLKGAAPQGTNQGGQAVAAGAQPLPPQVLQAYQSGQMTPSEMADLEHDVRSGMWQLPQGQTADALFGPAHQPKGVLDRLADTVTGNDRKTATTDKLPDWAAMPEMNQASWASFKTALGTLLSNPQETAQIIQSNFPNQKSLSDLILNTAGKGGVQVRQDQKGNYILRSGIDGQEYAIKPGFQVSDIPRAIAGLLAFTPAGRAETLIGAGAKSAATQAAIEGTQAATGGSFDPGEVVTAGALGAAVPAAARVIGAAADPVKAAMGRVLGRAEPAVADAQAAARPGGASTAGSPDMGGDPIHVAPDGTATMTGAPPKPIVTPSTVEGVAQTARQAAEKGAGSGAARDLASLASPDAETQAAAERLGITPYLQPDHVTTNDAFRQVVGVVKSSNPAGNLAQAEKDGLSKVAQRASDLIDEVGGTNDLSHLDASVKQRMQATHAELSTRESDLYQKLRDTIKPTTEAPAQNALAFVKQRAEELGGEKNLSPMEKDILAKLSPKGTGDADLVNSLGPAAKQQAMEQGAGAVKQPTYGLLDDVRKDVGAASKQRGPFKDADSGLAKKYYGLLTQDQEAVAQASGASDLWQQAKAATTVRKGMEDDLASLFGKNLDQSIVTQVSGAMKSAAAGDASKLLNVLKATPDSMKQEVVASGLGTVFRNAATRGEINFTGFAKWYDQLARNKQAFAAVMSNLPAQARTQIADLARVSKGISDSLNTRIKTGLMSTVRQEMMHAPDTLASRLFDLAKHAGKGLAADAVGGHGAGLAMGLMSALKGGAKPNAMKAIDELLTSPEFQHLASTAGTGSQEQAARSFAYSKAFTKFARAVGNPRELSNRERWVLQALQERNNMN